MAEIALYAKDKRLVTNAGALLPTNARPIVRWREQDTFTLRLADGSEFPEGAYHYAFDIDRDFLETEPCNTGECEIVGGSLVFTATFDSVRQAQATNNRRHPVAFYIQVTRDGHDYAEYIIDDALWADGCVWDGRIPPAPEAPNYYTKAEVDEIAEGKLNKPEEAGVEGYVLGLAEDGSTVWIPQSGGSAQQATDAEIDARESTSRTITPNNLDYAARSVLPNVTTIPAATTSYSLVDASATTNAHSWTYVHQPSSASTYVFPAVTDATTVHRIDLIIDFASVQTYSFEDAQGDPILPLFTPSISAGDVYAFKCEYSVVQSKWLIYPVKEGGVGDDYVMQSQVGAANGVATLDADGLIPRGELPDAEIVNTKKGVVWTTASYGLTINNGSIRTFSASRADIDAKNQGYKPIVPSNLDYAVRSVLPNVTTIPAATTAYSLLDASATTNNHSWQYAHTPSSASTYVFPAVTNTAVAHRIKLTIDFTDVQTYSFEDSQGAAITPLFTPSIAAGDVYEFDCEYSAVKGAWLIYPQKQGAVADDFVMRGEVGAANGVAGLDANGRVTSSELPTASYYQLGAIKVSQSQFGIDVWNQYARVVMATNDNINNRNHSFNAIVPSNLNYAVTAVLTDAHKIQMTDAQKASAQDTLGIWSPPVTSIPSATTAYTLAEGMQSHVPSSASTYTLPAIPQRIIADGRYFTRNPSTDGTGYYGWLSGAINRYTASATPAVGDNTYTNTALTQNAKAITAIDNRTHECILTVRFSSSVQTYAFEDSQGNPLTPLPLAGTIQDGSVVCFRCTWEALLNQWVIMPVMLGSVAPSVQQTLTVSGTGAQSNNLDGTYTLTNDTNNSRPVWYNSTNQKYIFAVENGMDAGWYAWVVGGTVVQQSAGDTMMFYTYCTYDVQGLSNLSETPDQSTTAWYSMGSEVSSSEFSVTA